MMPVFFLCGFCEASVISVLSPPFWFRPQGSAVTGVTDPLYLARYSRDVSRGCIEGVTGVGFENRKSTLGGRGSRSSPSIALSRPSSLASPTIPLGPSPGVRYHSRMFARHACWWSIAASSLVALLMTTGPRPARAAAAETWIELRSPNFIVVTNANEKQGRTVAYQFEMIRAVFQQFFKLQRSSGEQPVIILAAKDQATLKMLAPEHWAKRGLAHPAGIYLGGAEKNYVALRLDAGLDRGDEPFEPVYHEYVHYLTRRMMSHLPLWLVEGLAEFYGNTRLESRRVFVGAPSASNVLLLRKNPPLPLNILFRVDSSSPYYNEQEKASIFYAESWALTHYLITRDWREHTGRLNDFVGLLGTDVTPEEAARRTIGDTEQLQKALDAYLRSFTFMTARLDAPAKIDEKEFELVTITQAESLTVRADFMARDHHHAEARAMLGEALKLDPKLAAAHESMGFIYTEEGELEEADEWYEQAVALNSQSYLAHYYYAVNLLQGILNDETASKAESNLRAAIKINPDFAGGYDALASLLASRAGPAENSERLNEAHLMALKAISLEPGNVRYWLDSVQVLERMRRVDDAVMVASRAADMAGTPEEHQEAETALLKAQQYRDYRKQMEFAAKSGEQNPAHMTGENNDRTDTSSQISGAERPGSGHGTAPALQSSSEAASGGASQSPPDFAANRPAPAEPSERPSLLPGRRVVEGTIVESKCPRASTLELILSASAGTIVVYSDSYPKISIRALKYGPKGALDPCADMSGWHARITYHPAKEQPNQGEIVAVELGTN